MQRARAMRKRGLALSAVALMTSGCVSIAEFAVAQAGLPTIPDVPQPVFAPSIDIAANGRLTLTVDGRPISARAGPGLSSRLHLRRADAAALFGPTALDFETHGDWPGAFRAAERVGPVVARGHRASALLAVGGTPHPANVEWFQIEVADGPALLGPYAIPATVVRFALRDTQPGERSFTLPLDPENNGWGIASTSLMAGRQSVRFAFAPHFPRSVASAAAGGALARAQGGRFMGMPEPVLISHGIARPARPVRLDRALMIGPVRLIDVLVRTLDYGTAAGIADQVEEADNPADILVTGRTDRQAPNYIVYLGADVLGGCSSISFDKTAMTVTLSCVVG
jgi:hypothetical protein